MKIEDAERMALSLMKFHGLHDYKFRWLAKRMKFRLAGQCNWEKKEIALQPRFAICNYPVIVKRTLLHEIAHALTPKHGHDKHWKRMAIKIGDDGGRNYGREVKKRVRHKKPR